MTSLALRLWLAAGLVGGGVLQAGAQEVMSVRGAEAVTLPRAPLTLSELGLRSRAADTGGALSASDSSPVAFGVGLGGAGAGMQDPLRAMSAYATVRSGTSQMQLQVSTPLPRAGGGIGLGLSLLHRF